MLRKLYFLFYFLGLSVVIFAQKDGSEVIDGILENFAEENTVEDLSIISDYLYDLLDTPININTVGREDLEKLPMFTTSAVESLLKYRERVGRLYTLYELRELDGFSDEIFERIIPFVVVGEPLKKRKISWKDIWKYSHNSILIRSEKRLEKQEYYNEKRLSDFTSLRDYEMRKDKEYQGDSWKFYTKYRFKGFKDKVRAGLLLEKDSGERWWQNEGKGVDHLVGFVEVNDFGMLKKVIVGDYSADWGQGVVMWSRYAMYKTIDVLNVFKRNNGLSGYSSTDENKYLRGVGITLSPLKNMEFSSYYSNKYLDTNYDNQKGYFSSFLRSGYHRNRKELKTRKNLQEELLGVNLNYIYSGFKIGVNALIVRFAEQYKRDDRLLNKHQFKGLKQMNYGVYSSFRYSRVFCFSEFAMDKNQHKAWLCGANLDLDERLSLSILYRDYAIGYSNFHASGFSDGGKTQNERGCNFGLSFFPFAKWQLLASIDVYESPWLRTRKNAMSRGYDARLRLKYVPSDNWRVYIQYYREENQQNNAELPIHRLVAVGRERLRLHCRYKIGALLDGQTRLAFSRYQKERKKYRGIMLYQDVSMNFINLPLQVSARCMWFNTEDYQSRFYTYEKDVLYAFSVPSFYGEGIRCYLNTKWKLAENISIWLRYAITKSLDGRILQSPSATTTQYIKFQLYYKF